MKTTSTLPGFPESLSHSSLSAFLDCEEEWRNRYLLGIVPKGGLRSPKMIDGCAFAKGLEVARRLIFEAGMEPERAQAYGLGALLKEYATLAPEQEPKRGIYAYVDYLRRYPPRSDYLQPARFEGGRSGVEFTFAIPIPQAINPTTGAPMLFTGRCDMIASWRGGCFVVDEKTTGSIVNGWSDAWEIDGQILGYMWAADWYKHRVLGAVIRGISPQGEQTKFAEALVYWSPDKREQWLEWFLSVFRRIKRCYENNEWTLNRGFQCKMGGGCAYRKLCEAPNQTVRKNTLVQLYEERKHETNQIETTTFPGDANRPARNRKDDQPQNAGRGRITNASRASRSGRRSNNRHRS